MYRIAAAVGLALGKPYADLMTELVFAPLGMTRTTFRLCMTMRDIWTDLRHGVRRLQAKPGFATPASTAWRR